MINEKYKDILNVNKNNFITYNNIEVVAIEDNYAKLSVKLQDISMNPYGFAHGGLLFTLADTAMGIAVRTSGHDAVTNDATINYLRPGVGDEITCEANVIKMGQTIAFVEAKLYDQRNNLIAVCTSNYYFINIRKKEN